MRVPFPESSARDPSGFQIAISTRPFDDAEDLEHAVHAPGERRGRRGVEARVARLDDDVGVTERAPGRGRHPPPGRRVGRHRRGRCRESAASTCAGRPHSGGCARRSPRGPRRAGASRARGARVPSPRCARSAIANRAAHLVGDAALDHLVGTRRDPAVELVGRQVEADDRRSAAASSPTTEPIGRRYERRPGRSELERAHDSAAVVDVNRLPRRPDRARRERVCGVGVGVVERLGAPPLGRRRPPAGSRGRRERRGDRGPVPPATTAAP